MPDQDLLPYKSILIQVFTALDYGEDDFGELLMIFYMGLMGRYFKDEISKLKDFETDLERIIYQNLSDKDFVIKLRELILDENNLEHFNTVFKSFLAEYINSFYIDLDDHGKDIIDNVAKEYKINLSNK